MRAALSPRLAASNAIPVPVAPPPMINRSKGLFFSFLSQSHFKNHSPSLNFYIDSSQYGPLFNSAVGDNVFIGKEKETSILMVPYGFNKPVNGIGNLLLTWMINGYEREELATNESITLRSPDNTAGKSNIELTIKNKKDILQTASRGFSASFSANGGNTNQSNLSF
jgi:hypothetical protein